MKKFTSVPVNKLRQIEKAQKDLQEMEKEIAPFVKTPNREEVTTEGEWTKSSQLCY